MISGGKCIFAEIIQSQKCSKAHTPHTAFQSTFLSIQAIRKNPFVACKMESFIFVGVISLLENSYIVCTAFMQVCILIRIHGIDFQTDDTEIFFRNLTCLSDIFHIGFGTAFAGENQNFLKTGFGNGRHFFLDFIRFQLGTVNFVVTVKATVNTVVLAVVCYIERCEHIDAIAEMLSCFLSGSLSDFFQKRKGSRRQQCSKILRCTVVMCQSPADICFGVLAVIIIVHGRDYLVHHIGFQYFHTRQIFHMIDSILLLILQDFLI